jgi:hypothetical protein
MNTASNEKLLQSQIKRLADFIVDEVPGEPSQSEGAIDTAIRVIRKLMEPTESIVKQSHIDVRLIDLPEVRAVIARLTTVADAAQRALAEASINPVYNDANEMALHPAVIALRLALAGLDSPERQET